MRKQLFILIFGLVLSACTAVPVDNSTDNNDPIVEKPLKKGEVSLNIDQVLLKDNSAFGYDSTLEFDLYLERPDVGLKEPINDGDVYSVDLPIELQPRLMYVSAVDNLEPEEGSMCDRPTFPHRCGITVTEWEDFKEEYTFLIKITFEDGTYAQKEVTVPFPKTIALPEIIEPSIMPNQGDSFNIEFKDVGADMYEVTVNLCWPYQDDGINPCLGGVNYSLKRANGVLVFQYDDGYTNPELSVNKDVVNIKSNFALQFGESIEYSVKAILIDKTQGGIPSYTEISDFNYFGNEVEL